MAKTLSDFYGPNVNDVVDESATAPSSTTWDFGDLSDATLSGAELDFSGLTGGVPCFTNIQMYSYLGRSVTAGASDNKCFDPRDSTIVCVQVYDSINFAPETFNHPYGEGRDTNYEWLDFSMCGRLYTNVDTIVPVDFEGGTATDITVPNHGFPLNVENKNNWGTVFITQGDYGTTGTLETPTTFVIDSILDENTIRLATSVATWNAGVAKSTGQNLYFNGGIMHNAGNSNWSTNTMSVHWKFNRNSPTFLDSVWSDD